MSNQRVRSMGEMRFKAIDFLGNEPFDFKTCSLNEIEDIAWLKELPNGKFIAVYFYKRKRNGIDINGYNVDLWSDGTCIQRKFCRRCGDQRMIPTKLRIVQAITQWRNFAKEIDEYSLA